MEKRSASADKKFTLLTVQVIQQQLKRDQSNKRKRKKENANRRNSLTHPTLIF